MNNFEADIFKDADKIDKAIVDLSIAVNRPENIVYSEGSGSLPIQMVEPERFEDPKFREVVDVYDWPTLQSDGDIGPVHRYQSARIFLESLRREHEGHPREIGTHNFIILVGQVPIRRIADMTTGLSGYGVNPVLHRAHALAPDLFGPLQTVLSGMQEQLRYVYSDNDVLYTWMRHQENESVVEALYQAYRIMGRLIKIDDYKRRSDISYGNMESSVKDVPIVDAHRELMVGN